MEFLAGHRSMQICVVFNQIIVDHIYVTDLRGISSGIAFLFRTESQDRSQHMRGESRGREYVRAHSTQVSLYAFLHYFVITLLLYFDKIFYLRPLGMEFRLW